MRHYFFLIPFVVLTACGGASLGTTVAAIIEASKAACGLFFTEDAALNIKEQYPNSTAAQIAHGFCTGISQQTRTASLRSDQVVIFRLPDGQVVEGILKATPNE